MTKEEKKEYLHNLKKYYQRDVDPDGTKLAAAKLYLKQLSLSDDSLDSLNDAGKQIESDLEFEKRRVHLMMHGASNSSLQSAMKHLQYLQDAQNGIIGLMLNLYKE